LIKAISAGDGEVSQDTKGFALVTGVSSGIGAIYAHRLRMQLAAKVLFGVLLLPAREL
jgi:NAD(P)-dependent dehydrogenase (short-subunit alcohol dehydrogenase family)